jgi:hypothetical protein
MTALGGEYVPWADSETLLTASLATSNGALAENSVGRGSCNPRLYQMSMTR